MYQRYEFDDWGQRLYSCLNCMDAGWIHPIKEDGKIDYSKVVRCPCKKQQREETSQLSFQESETL
jgi:hypothetical protein